LHSVAPEILEAEATIELGLSPPLDSTATIFALPLAPVKAITSSASTATPKMAR
jgi:hypothetical protein